MASIAASIARIKRDALGALGREVVEGLCEELNYAWRDRELDPGPPVERVRRVQFPYEAQRSAASESSRHLGCRVMVTGRASKTRREGSIPSRPAEFLTGR